MENGRPKKKSKEEKLRGKTRRQGGIKKRGRQKGKENGRERGQGGAVQTGTKLETQCVVIHCSLQLLCACLCLSVWVSGCELVCVRVCTSARLSAGTDSFFF